MSVPEKIFYADIESYRRHFESNYCAGPIVTFDGIPVHFRRNDFNHCMFESSMRNGIKDTFSFTRAQRINWIKETLTNPEAELYFGYDKNKKQIRHDRRVSVVFEDFVVIIGLKKENVAGNYRGWFITAFQADNSITKIKNMKKWERK